MSGKAAASTTAKAPAKTAGTAKTAKGDSTAKPTKKKVRKRKPAGSSSTKASSNKNILQDARVANAELTAAKALEAANRKDPLWYRTSEVLQSISADSTPAAGILSEQVELVESALLNNELTRADVTPQAFGILLEQARRYALELVSDAQDCAYMAHRHDVARNDLIMAVELRPDIPNTHALAELQKMTVFSHKINKIPLPPIPQHCYSGIVLPPKPHQLTARTFDVVTGAQVAQKMLTSLPKPSSSADKKSTAAASHGATRGRQIPINMSATDPSKPTPQTSSGGGGGGIKRKAGDL